MRKIKIINNKIKYEKPKIKVNKISINLIRKEKDIDMFNFLARDCDWENY
jgi:hypothetical protein